MCDNDRNLELDQVGCDFGIAVATALGPASLDRDGATLNPTEFAQSLHKGGGPWTLSGRRARTQVSNGRQPARLLRPCRDRPCRRASEQRDELAPLHSITSSARASSVGGTWRPRALAVLRLITSSYLVGACTGRSAGFSPLRMRST